MEELFVENFFRHNENQLTERAIEVLEKPKESPLNFPNKASTIDMLIILDSLELEIEKEYLDFADYRCLFNKIRAELKKNSVKGVLTLLNDLEDLLDLGTLSKLRLN